jgi:molybdopterin/thiamine biosynthesis adenylyltransferase
MKKLILCLIIIVLPIFAEEISLGMVDSVKGDTLTLVDGLKICVPNLSRGRYIDENNVAISVTSVTFPFTASLVRDETLPKHLRDQNVFVKIHKFYKLVQGRAVELQKYE